METLIEDNNYNCIKTQADAVLYFLQNLDIDMIDLLLPANRTYQDFDKHIFIQKLGEALEEFKSDGDTFLNQFSGHCNSQICNFNCAGFAYVGNHSGNYFYLIVDIKDGEVMDMYECSNFKTADFVKFVGKNIKIDKLDLLF